MLWNFVIVARLFVVAFISIKKKYHSTYFFIFFKNALQNFVTLVCTYLDLLKLLITFSSWIALFAYAFQELIVPEVILCYVNTMQMNRYRYQAFHFNVYLRVVKEFTGKAYICYKINASCDNAKMIRFLGNRTSNDQYFFSQREGLSLYFGQYPW